MADVERHPSSAAECETALRFRRNFGLKVRYFRLGAGLTKEQVAAHLGIPTRDFSRIEHGYVACSLSELAMLAAVVDTDVGQLINYDNDYGSGQHPMDLSS